MNSVVPFVLTILSLGMSVLSLIIFFMLNRMQKIERRLDKLDVENYALGINFIESRERVI
jgi:hypothetical protein